MRIFWFKRAVADLIRVREHIARSDPDAAHRMSERIAEAVSQLAEFPWMGRPERVPGTRELVVPGTPFVVPYRVRDDVVQILRVLHGARRWPS